MGPQAFPAPFIAYRAGAWYGVGSGGVLANQPVVADTAYAFPIWLDRPATIGRIAMSVGTSVPGVTGQMALYDTRLDLPAPGRLITGSLTNYDMNAAANTVHELVFSPAILRGRGFVWGVTRFNGAAQPRTAINSSTAGAAGLPFQMILGALNALAVQGASTFTNTRVTAPSTYASAWPADFGTPTIGNNVPGSPVIAWRID